MFKKSRVYLDYAAATPLSPLAYKAMKPWLELEYANPSAIHAEGQRARQAIEIARARVAEAVKVRPEYVTFTSGGTEANNLAIFGVIEALHATGRSYDSMEVITTRIEHPSMTEAMKVLEAKGVQVRYVGVSSEGIIQREQLRLLLSPQTVLVAFAYANSEIGVVQPVRAIRRVIDEAATTYATTVLLLLDAAQAPLWLNCQLDALQADLMTFDAGKCNGPKGVGFLIARRTIPLRSYLHGGGQESGVRPGTENVAGIVGASVAFALAQEGYKVRAAEVAKVRDEGIACITKSLPQAVLNGPAGSERIANNINISLPGLDTEFATVVLDKHGFAVSTKSACAGAGGGASVVVQTISNDTARASSTLRMTLSPAVNVGDIKRLASVLQTHIEKMRGLT